jgi:acyl-CoA reductase-like NAD-dependent aldehyde dehydrogenase
VQDALQQGAVLLTGGESKGVLMPATVVDKVTPRMRLFHEESFAPVAALVRAADEGDAVRLANDTEYGLAASVFTADVACGLRVAPDQVGYLPRQWPDRTR